MCKKDARCQRNEINTTRKQEADEHCSTKGILLLIRNSVLQGMQERSSELLLRLYFDANFG